MAVELEAPATAEEPVSLRRARAEVLIAPRAAGDLLSWLAQRLWLERRILPDGHGASCPQYRDHEQIPHRITSTIGWCQDRTMPDWIDMDEATVGADKPLHAGMLHALRGNLEQTIVESGHRYQSIAHGATDYAEHTHSAADEWEDLTPEYGWWPIQIRRDLDGDLRQIRFIVEGLVETAGTTITVRVFALTGLRVDLEVDTTDGLLGTTAYDDITFTSTTWETQEGTITLADSERVGDVSIRAAGVPATTYERVVLYAISQSDVTSKYVRLRSPFVEEVVP